MGALYSLKGGRSEASFDGGVISSALSLPSGSAAAPALNFSVETNSGLFRSGSNILGWSIFGVMKWFQSSLSWVLNSALFIQWAQNTSTGGGVTTGLGKDSADGSIAIRHQTQAQRLGIYETFTDVSNYARLVLDTQGGGNYLLAPQAAGTGTLRKLNLGNIGQIDIDASLTTNVTPNDDTTRKKLSLQKLSSPPTNAAYIAFVNNPGIDVFYLVLEEGA